MMKNTEFVRGESCVISRSVLLLLLFVTLCVAQVRANVSQYVNHWHQDYPSTLAYNSRIIRSRRDLLSNQNECFHFDLVVPAARKSRSLALKKGNPRRLLSLNVRTDDFFAGTRRVLTDALGDYIFGFCTGYVAGAISGLPALLFGPTPAAAGLRTSSQFFLSPEITGRLGQMNFRSLQWALWLGEVMGTLRGCDTAVRLIRYPKNDVWNQVYGCSTAGAILARNRKYSIVWGNGSSYRIVLQIF